MRKISPLFTKKYFRFISFSSLSSYYDWNMTNRENCSPQGLCCRLCDRWYRRRYNRITKCMSSMDMVRRIKIQQLRIACKMMIPRRAFSTRDPWEDSGSNGAHACNAKAMCITTCLHLGCATGVFSQVIEVTGKFMYFRPRSTHSCSVNEKKSWFSVELVRVLSWKIPTENTQILKKFCVLAC